MVDAGSNCTVAILSLCALQYKGLIEFDCLVLLWLCSPLHKSCFPELPLLQRVWSAFREVQRTNMDVQKHRKQPADAQRGLGGGAGSCWAVSTSEEIGMCLSLGIGAEVWTWEWYAIASLWGEVSSFLLAVSRSGDSGAESKLSPNLMPSLMQLSNVLI